MFENVTHLRFTEGAFDQGWQIVKHQIAPILRRQHGLISLALLPNRAMGQVSILSLWASPSCSRAVEHSAALRHAVDGLDGLLIPEPESARPVYPSYRPPSRELCSN